MNPSATVQPLPAIAEALESPLRRGRDRASEIRGPVLVSVALPLLTAGTPVEAFAAGGRPGSFRALWGRPSLGFWLVGIGSAAAITMNNARPLTAVERWYRSLLDGAVVDGPGIRGVGPVLMGGVGFDPIAPRSTLWVDFPNVLFVLPRFLFTTLGRDRWLTVNVVVKPGTDLQVEAELVTAEVARLTTGPFPYPAQPLSYRREHSASDEWAKGVRQALRAIKDGDLAKVVLARHMTLVAEEGFSPEAALQWLSDAYPDCSVFAVTTGRSTFLGASPEVLVSLHDGQVSLSCLAGTASRGESSEEDQRHAHELLESAKNKQEHSAVVDAVARTLRRVCQELQWDDTPRLMALPTMYHLATSFTGRLQSPVNILRLVKMLHPTPAVGGVPTQRALEAIRRLEGDRGWYAAPVGWVDRQGDGEFTVAIRSALVSGQRATLFAGSGIVAGSDPDQEMAETNLKFQPLLAALRRS